MGEAEQEKHSVNLLVPQSDHVGRLSTRKKGKPHVVLDGQDSGAGHGNKITVTDGVNERQDNGAIRGNSRTPEPPAAADAPGLAYIKM